MSKQALFIGTIASIITINSVLADTRTSTVTSRGYVDAEVAKKQDVIESAMIRPGSPLPWMDDSTAFTSIASYDDDDGLVANKIGILTRRRATSADTDPSYYFDLDDDTERAIAEKMVPTVAAVAGDIQDLNRNKQNELTCAGWPDGVAKIYENCWLWRK